MLVNHASLSYFGIMEVEHLARTGSDHTPLLLKCGSQSKFVSKPFRFLKILD